MGATTKGFSKLDSNDLIIVKVNTWLDSYLLWVTSCSPPLPKCLLSNQQQRNTPSSKFATPDLVIKASDDEIVVFIQSDGGSGITGIGNGVCIGNPSTKFVAPIRLCHQIDR